MVKFEGCEARIALGVFCGHGLAYGLADFLGIFVGRRLFDAGLEFAGDLVPDQRFVLDVVRSYREAAEVGVLMFPEPRIARGFDG